MTTHLTITGNLTQDPELRFTPNGQAVASAGIASNRRYQDRSGEWQEQTSFYDLVIWGQLGENAASSLTKGARVLVEGRLEQRTFETNDGATRTKVEVIVTEIAASLRYATVTIAKTPRPDDQRDS